MTNTTAPAVPDPNTKPYLTKAEVAAILGGITTRTVTNLIARGQLRAVRIGRADHVKTSSLRRYLEIDVRTDVVDGPTAA